MACGVCANRLHNRQRCQVDIRAYTPETLWALRCDNQGSEGKYGVGWKKLHEWERKALKAEFERRLAAYESEHQASAPPAPAGSVETVNEPSAPRRTVVIIAAEGGRVTEAYQATTKGDADRWHVIVAHGLAAGVRTAIALRAEHTVLCLGAKMDTSTLRPWTDRLRSIYGVQIITIYDTSARRDEIRAQREAIGADCWISNDSVATYLEKEIAEWEPKEEWLKPPEAWTVPSPLKFAN